MWAWHMNAACLMWCSFQLDEHTWRKGYERGASLTMEGNHEGPKAPVTSDVLQFVQNHVLSVTDLVRTKKLSEILDSYADTTSDEIFVVQNGKNKNAKAVLSDLEYFQKLLKYQEIVEQAIDLHMLEVTLQRKNDVAELSLSDVLEHEDIHWDEVVACMGEIELED